jgi:hypothetical protein
MCLESNRHRNKEKIMEMYEKKFEASINLYSEGNKLFDDGNKLCDEADKLCEEGDRITDEIDKIDIDSENLREEQSKIDQKYNLAIESGGDSIKLLKESEEITAKLFQFEADFIKLRRRMRDLYCESGNLSAKARAVHLNASMRHTESRKLWLEGMIEWKKASTA